jgi:DNA-binding transcriptional regulator YiaG
LEDIARRRHCDLSDLTIQINGDHTRVSSLTAAIRIFVLQFYRHSLERLEQSPKSRLNRRVLKKPNVIATITRETSRAARGLLDWSQSQLATAAHLSDSTVRNFEAARSVPTADNLASLQRVFEAAGVEFLPDNGVRFHTANVKPAAGGAGSGGMMKAAIRTAQLQALGEQGAR